MARNKDKERQLLQPFQLRADPSEEEKQDEGHCGHCPKDTGRRMAHVHQGRRLHRFLPDKGRRNATQKRILRNRIVAQ